MDLEVLIAEVEKSPEAWNPRDPGHCNRDLMAKCWAEIAGIIQMQGIYNVNTYFVYLSINRYL